MRFASVSVCVSTSSVFMFGPADGSRCARGYVCIGRLVFRRGEEVKLVWL